MFPLPLYTPDESITKLTDVVDIQKGNHKLGVEGSIWYWSLPAGHTCPGKTAVCTGVCYAMKGHFHRHSVEVSHSRSFYLSKSSEFTLWLIKKIKNRRVPVFRVHCSGDIYSVEYAYKLREVFEWCPKTTFFLYTRSWRDPAFLPVLTEMAQLYNCHLWLSADRDTGQPPTIPNTRIAYMLTEGDEPPDYPVGLLFRDSRHDRGVIHKYISDTLVCPQEQGHGHITTCEKCKLCFSHRSTHRSPHSV